MISQDHSNFPKSMLKQMRLENPKLFGYKRLDAVQSKYFPLKCTHMFIWNIYWCFQDA